MVVLIGRDDDRINKILGPQSQVKRAKDILKSSRGDEAEFKFARRKDLSVPCRLPGSADAKTSNGKEEYRERLQWGGEKNSVEPSYRQANPERKSKTFSVYCQHYFVPHG